MFKLAMEQKYENEKKYTQKSKKIIKNKELNISEKRTKLRELAKKTLKRNSFYNKSSFSSISKTLKKGLNENRLARRDDVSEEINKKKRNILTLKYKLLYGFSNEDEIDETFESEIREYKAALRKRQNIDFLNERKKKDKNAEVNNIKKNLEVLYNNYNSIKEKDKLIKFYIEEIIPLRNELFEKQNQDLDVIEDPIIDKSFYLYRKKY